ncbi:MAG: VWA domain-containing protein [Planctomycetes bacterium]|nr:VWA domain-containing protein [Planctomycetota bacterium]
MPNSHSLDFQVRLDTRHCPTAGGRVHLICELAPPSLARAIERAPLDLVLVIDASGSMNGPKLDAVKLACAGILGRLRPGDRVSLVTFANDVLIHAHCVQPGSAAASTLERELRGLVTRGNTNLSGGWLTGVELAGASIAGGRRASVVLLSDGQANEGVVSPSQLAEMARRSAAQGISTTCVGVGADYSTEQLGTIAEASGGRFHHASAEAEIVQVLLGELDELSAVYLERVELALDAPQDFVVQPLGGTSGRVAGALQLVSIGSLYAGVERKVVVALDVPPRMEGSSQVLHIALTGTLAESGEPLTVGESVGLRWSDSLAIVIAPADLLLVEQHTAAWLERTCADLNERGDFGQVQRLRRRFVPRMRAYARDDEHALAEVARVEAQLAAAEVDMAPMVRKEMYVRSVKAPRGERDLRGS